MLTTLNRSAHDTGLDDGSVQCIITSPPYWGLRAYAGEQDVEWPTVTYQLNEWCEPVTVDPWFGPLGLEPSPVAYIGHLILCLREWRRVLRDDGTCFINLGDSYASSGISGLGTTTGHGKFQGGAKTDSRIRERVCPFGLKPKDLLMIPAMFAIAARADGWWLRSDIIWHKPNPMPESVRDRPTKAHEYVFMLAKSARYYWDQDAVREEAITEGDCRFERTDNTQQFGRNGDDSRKRTGNPTNGRNIRSVWTIATRPYPAAHYAVFPPDLVEPMVLSSTSERGCCPQCGAPWKRVVKKVGDERPTVRNQNSGYIPPGQSSQRTMENGTVPSYKSPDTTTIGWQPTCDCPDHEPIPCTVLDPFAGSGTTGSVAIQHRRKAILCDISREYLDEHVPDRTTVQMQLV